MSEMLAKTPSFKMWMSISEHVRNFVPEHYQNLKDFEVLKFLINPLLKVGATNRNFLIKKKKI